MGTNYTKENIPEMNINSIHSDINSNMNERISVINDFIHSNSFSKNESISPLKIKKSNLNKNCNIENILKISENITSNYFQKDNVSSNESLYLSLFLYKDLNIDNQTTEKLVKSRLKKMNNLLGFQRTNPSTKRIKTKNNEQTQSVYSKNISSYTGDINSDLNDTKSKIFNILKIPEELNSNYIKQNSIIKEEREFDCFTNPLTIKSKKLYENNYIQNKKKEFSYSTQQEYSKQVRSTFLNKNLNSSPNTTNYINNEIINSNRSTSPRLKNYIKSTKFGNQDNNNILNLPLGGSIINFFKENLSPNYEESKNIKNIKKTNSPSVNKNTLKNKLKNTNYKIDIKEIISNKDKTESKNKIQKIKDDKISNNNIFKTEINTKKNKQNKKKSKDFISKYEELLGVDQSYKTKKPKIYITSYDALNDKKNYQFTNECDYENLNNTLGNIIEEDSDFNNISYLDIKNTNQKKENLKREYFFNKSKRKKFNYFNQISDSMIEPKNNIANTISSYSPRGKGSTTFISIEKKDFKK